MIFQNATLSQFYFFGRNKVQYSKFDWKLLQTAHFDIYYYGELDEITSIGAHYAEEAYSEYQRNFVHIITKRIPLIFYNTHNHFQQTNTTPGFIPDGVGGFFEFIKGRVVIPFSGSLEQFRHVIRHELVHVFMTTKIFRVLADHRQTSDRLPPLWFVEGLAEHLSTTWDSQAEMLLRDAVINNYFVGIEDIYSISGSFLMYKEGQAFLDYVAELYGPEKVFIIMNNFWLTEDFNKILEYALDKPLEQIDKEWKFYLKKKYFPLLSEYTSISDASLLATQNGFCFSPVKYENGSGNYIYFLGNVDGYSSFYRAKFDDEEKKYDSPELLVRGEKREEFESFHLFQNSLDVSSNGLAVFVTKRGETDAIHFYDVNEEKIIKSFQKEYLISISSPKFSSSGKKIVFKAIDQKGFSDLFTLDIESDDEVRLTNDYHDDTDPAFGKDDDDVIFVSNRFYSAEKKYYDLFSINIKDYRINKILSMNATLAAPVYNHTDNKIYFTSDYSGVHNIYKYNPSNDDEVVRVSNFYTSVFNPRFSNGKIIFSGFDSFSFKIYEYKIDSTAEKKISLPSHETFSMFEWNAPKISLASNPGKINYEKEYTLDYAQSQITTDPVFGTRGGAVFTLSDLFGDDNYFFLIYNTAEVQSDFLKSFNVALTRVSLSERSNYGYGIFHFSGRRYDIRESEEFFFERSFGGNFILNFPLSKFSRIEAGLSIANSDKQIISGVLERKALLWTNNLSYVSDNTIWVPTGPIDGMRYRVLLAFTSDVKFSNVNYFTFISDYRHYFRTSLRSAVALRLAMFYNQGKEARRYFMGGSWDLRGWPRWSIRGEKMWLSSLEYRFPLIDQFQVRFPFTSMSIYGIRGALFFDAGNAWDSKNLFTYGSVGAGIRINLFNLLVLRYDIGKKIEDNFADFQPGLFYQFFFGWDF